MPKTMIRSRALRQMLAAALLTLAAGPASGQTASEVQLCVNSCLANANGPDDPAYEACVATHCAEPAAEPRWTLETITPEHPPYLDGRVASITVPGGGLRVSFVCGRAGKSFFFLENGGLGRLDSTSPHRLEVEIDGARHPLEATGFEGGWTAPADPGGALVAALRAGQRATLVDPEGVTLGTVPLGGSSRALGGAVGYCAR